jgi:hypothetical protein
MNHWKHLANGMCVLSVFNAKPSGCKVERSKQTNTIDDHRIHIEKNNSLCAMTSPIHTRIGKSYSAGTIIVRTVPDLLHILVPDAC